MNTTLFDNIDWVGAVDWTIRDFHSYETDAVRPTTPIWCATKRPRWWTP